MKPRGSWSQLGKKEKLTFLNKTEGSVCQLEAAILQVVRNGVQVPARLQPGADEWEGRQQLLESPNALEIFRGLYQRVQRCFGTISLANVEHVTPSVVASCSGRVDFFTAFAIGPFFWKEGDDSARFSSPLPGFERHGCGNHQRQRDGLCVM